MIDELSIGIMIGMGFVITMLIIIWLFEAYFKKIQEEREERMTQRLMEALEQMQRRKNGRTKRQSNGRSK